MYQMLDDTATDIVRDTENSEPISIRRHEWIAILTPTLCLEQATQLKDFVDWQQDGVEINKLAKSISILEFVEHTKSDG